MTEQPRLRLAVAPGFHMNVDWSRRVMMWSDRAGKWRPPESAEVAAILLPAANPADRLQFLQLPQHLMEDWWQRLESRADAVAAGALPDFESFAQRIVEFLAFKGQSLPARARVDATVTSIDSPRACTTGRETWGAFNLGGDAIYIEFSGEAAPLLRVVLEPGDGIQFAGAEATVTTRAAGEQSVDVVLWIRGAAS